MRVEAEAARAARLEKQQGGGGGSGGGGFVAAEAFEGRREGCVFGTREGRTGYWPDPTCAAREPQPEPEPRPAEGQAEQRLQQQEEWADEDEDPLAGYWLEGDSLAPPCQADHDCVAA